MHTLLFLTDDNQPIYTNTFTEEVKGNKKLEIFSMHARNDGGRRLCQLPATDTAGDKEYDDHERPGRRQARRQRHRRCICRRRNPPRYTKAAKCPSASSARQTAEAAAGPCRLSCQWARADAFCSFRTFLFPPFNLFILPHLQAKSSTMRASKKFRKKIPKRGSKTRINAVKYN
jgi:hypothetical protein